MTIPSKQLSLAAAPTDGYALTWSAGSSTWISSKPIPGGAAAGDLSSTYPKPVVAKMQGRTVASTSPTGGFVLAWNSGSSQWEPTTTVHLLGSSTHTADTLANLNAKVSDADLISDITSAGGDLSGTYPNPTVAKIQGYSVATTTPNDGYALVYKTGTAKWTPENHIKFGGYTGAATDAYGMMIPSVNNTLALWSNKVSGSTSISAEIVANVNSATIDADHKIAAFYWRDNTSTKHEVFNIKDGEINITTAASAAMLSDQADGGSSVAVTLGSTNSFVTTGAKLLSIMNGDPAGLERAYFDYRGDLCINKLDNAQCINHKSLTELTTIAAAADGYSTIQLPVNSLIIGVNARVTTVIPTATTFSIGISGSKTKYATGISVAAGTATACLSNGIHYNTSATSLCITPSATPATATGKVRLTINYIDMTVPTS